MPRNGSGTHSIPNIFSSGTTISSSAVNANFTDIATEITNSLPRDGQAAMTGQLQATAGSATSPGIAFSGDTNTGVFRKAADTLGFSAGGTEIASATSTAFTITGLTATSASLTTPTIAGATFSGTLAGTPTFSGALTFSGVPTFADGFTVTGGTPTIPSINIENADTTITRASAGVIAVEGSNVLLASGLASQSDQETGTSTSKIVTSGTQKFHPLSPKAWALVTFSGTTPSLGAGTGFASITRNSTGNYTVTLSTAMSSTAYAIFYTPHAVNGRTWMVNLSRTTSTFTFSVHNTDGSGVESIECSIMVFGDQ
jgi:hypothetical protein